MDNLKILSKDDVTILSIGRAVRDARKARRLKQVALAAQLGYKTHTTLNQIERGKVVPSLDMAARIEKSLGLPKHSIAALVIKYRVKEATTSLLHEAAERGIEIEVSLNFK